MSRHIKLASMLALGLMLAACGEDEEAPPPKPRGNEAAAPRGPARGAGAATPGASLPAYKRVEDLAADDKERLSLRHSFRETDFTFDPTGTVNRDPFRSFVIAQPGVTTGGDALAIEPTELCPSKRQIASTYGARELKLNGIVARGTMRWALFSDTAQRGHIVHRNDCIGKEKGRVIEIGATYVKAEISPEPVPNQPPRPAEVVIYELHPRQLPIGEEIEEVTPEESRTRGPAGSPASTQEPPTRGVVSPGTNH